MDVAELEIEAAAFGDAQRVVQRLRERAEEALHFIGRVPVVAPGGEFLRVALVQ